MTTLFLWLQCLLYLYTSCVNATSVWLWMPSFRSQRVTEWWVCHWLQFSVWQINECSPSHPGAISDSQVAPPRLLPGSETQSRSPLCAGEFPALDNQALGWVESRKHESIWRRDSVQHCVRPSGEMKWATVLLKGSECLRRGGWESADKQKCESDRRRLRSDHGSITMELTYD